MSPFSFPYIDRYMIQLQKAVSQYVTAHLGENGVSETDSITYSFVNQMTGVRTEYAGTIGSAQPNNGRAVKSFAIDLSRRDIGMYLLEISILTKLQTTLLCYIRPVTNPPVEQNYLENTTVDTDIVYQG